VLVIGYIGAQDNPTPYEIALQRIEQAAASRATMLSLYDLGLTEVPPTIGQLTNLQVLSLASNQLTSLPLEIAQLSNLVGLDLQSNQFRHLPAVIGQLPKLEWIHAHNNPLISPPPEVVEQGTAAMRTYFHNQAWYHTQRLIIGVAGGLGLCVSLLLFLRWKQRSEYKSKKKHEVA
jgi:hypothetical protein